MERLRLAPGVADGVGGHDGGREEARAPEGAEDAGAIAAVGVAVDGETEALGEGFAEGAGVFVFDVVVDRAPQPRRVPAEEIDGDAGEAVPRHPLFRLPRLPLRVKLVAPREEAAEVRVAGVVLDVHRDAGVGRRRARRELVAHDEPHAVLRRFFLRPDHSVEAVTVGDAEGVVSELGGAPHELLGRRRGLEEREARAGGRAGARWGRSARAPSVHPPFHPPHPRHAVVLDPRHLSPLLAPRGEKIARHEPQAPPRDRLDARQQADRLAERVFAAITGIGTDKKRDGSGASDVSGVTERGGRGRPKGTRRLRSSGIQLSPRASVPTRSSPRRAASSATRRGSARSARASGSKRWSARASFRASSGTRRVTARMGAGMVHDSTRARTIGEELGRAGEGRRVRDRQRGEGRRGRLSLCLAQDRVVERQHDLEPRRGHRPSRQARGEPIAQRLSHEEEVPRSDRLRIRAPPAPRGPPAGRKGRAARRRLRRGAPSPRRAPHQAGGEPLRRQPLQIANLHQPELLQPGDRAGIDGERREGERANRLGVSTGRNHHRLARPKRARDRRSHARPVGNGDARAPPNHPSYPPSKRPRQCPFPHPHSPPQTNARTPSHPHKPRPSPHRSPPSAQTTAPPPPPPAAPLSPPPPTPRARAARRTSLSPRRSSPPPARGEGAPHARLRRAASPRGASARLSPRRRGAR